MHVLSVGKRLCIHVNILGMYIMYVVNVHLLHGAG